MIWPHPSALALVICMTITACAAPPQTPLFKNAVLVQKLKYPSTLLAADVNGDGHMDLLVRSEHGLDVLLGNDAGQFRAHAVVELPVAADEVVCRDINKDGRLDLAIVAHNSYGVTILLGDGAGGFTPMAGSPFFPKRGEHPHTHGLAVGDLNGDGQLDLVTANSDDGDVAVMLADAKGGFVVAGGSPFPCGKAPYPIALADINADGKLDLLVPNCATPGTVSILLGEGDGKFSSLRSIACDERPYFVAVGDVNGDGKPDFIVSHDDADTATIFLGDGKGSAVKTTNSPIHLGKRAWQMVIVDMDGDGKLDLVAAAEDAVRVLLGDGGGGFHPATGSPFATGKGTWTLAMADFNEDKKLDVAVSSLETGQVFLLLGN
jgi:hypothetical protein